MKWSVHQCDFLIKFSLFLKKITSLRKHSRTLSKNVLVEQMASTENHFSFVSRSNSFYPWIFVFRQKFFTGRCFQASSLCVPVKRKKFESKLLLLGALTKEILDVRDTSFLSCGSNFIIHLSINRFEAFWFGLFDSSRLFSLFREQRKVQCAKFAWSFLSELAD